MHAPFVLSYPVGIVVWDGVCIRRTPLDAVRRQLTALRAAEISHIMVAGFQFEEKADFDIMEAASELGRLFADEGFAISSHHSLTANFAPLDQSQREVLDKLARNIEFGARLKANVLVTHPERSAGHHKTVESIYAAYLREEERHGRDAVIGVIADNFRAMGEWARAAGLTVALENLGRFGPLGDLETLPLLVRRTDHPSVGYCLDAGHAHAFGESVPHWVDVMGDKLFTTHFHDNRGKLAGVPPTTRFVAAGKEVDEHLSPGFGTIPWIDVIQSLRRIGYSRPVNFETGGWPGMEETAGCRQAIAWWRTCERLADSR